MSELPNHLPNPEIDLAAIKAKLDKKTNQQLWSLINNCYAGIANLIAEAAVSVVILESRGENTKGIPLIGTYRRVAAGQVDPELISVFIESANRQLVERLPMPDQKKLAKDPFVVVAEGNDDKRKVDLRTAPREIAKLVCGDEGIRTIDEQRAVRNVQKSVPAIVPEKRKDEDIIKEPLTREIKAKFTEAEWQDISHHAIDEKVQPWVIVRRRYLRGESA